MPPGGVLPSTAVNRLILSMVLDAPVNDSFYYFMALDDNGNSADGPLPLRRPGANGWGTGSFSTFVQYHFRQYQVFSHVVNPDNSITETPVDQPFGFTLPSGTNQLSVTLNLDNYFASSVERLDINFITTNEIIRDPNINVDKIFDGLGPTGNTYLTVPININAVYDNLTYPFPSGREQAGDAPPTYEALDIVDWRIEVQRG